MVKRRWHFLLWLDSVEGFDATVYAEPDRSVEALQECLANWSLHTFDPQPTGVNDVWHDLTPSPIRNDRQARARMLQFSPMFQSSSMLRVTGAFWLAGVILTGGWSSTAETQQAEAGPAGVVNYTRVDATVACAGATPPSAMTELKSRGFVSVINFRTAGEPGANIEEGRAAAEDAGLRYFHLPFSRATPEVTETFLGAVAEPANQPVFIHCGSANRVGAMWLIKRVKIDRWSVEDATAEAEAIGLRSVGLKAFALDYVGASER